MKKGYLPVLILFGVVTIAVLSLKNPLLAAGINPKVVIGGNILLFLVTIVSMALHQSAMGQGNTAGFMRNVYGGFMLKFFVLIVATLLYLILGKPINKPAVFICLGLYLVYTFLGTSNVLHHKKPVTDGSGKSRV